MENFGDDFFGASFCDKCRELKAERDDNKRIYDETLKALKEKIIATSELIADYEAVCEENKKLEEHVTRAQEANTTFHSQVISYENTITELTEEKLSSIKTVQQLNASNTELQQKVEALRKQILSIEFVNESLREALAEHGAMDLTIRDLKNKLSSYKLMLERQKSEKPQFVRRRVRNVHIRAMQDAVMAIVKGSKFEPLVSKAFEDSFSHNSTKPNTAALTLSEIASSSHNTSGIIEAAVSKKPSDASELFSKAIFNSVTKKLSAMKQLEEKRDHPRPKAKKKSPKKSSKIASTSIVSPSTTTSSGDEPLANLLKGNGANTTNKEPSDSDATPNNTAQDEALDMLFGDSDATSNVTEPPPAPVTSRKRSPPRYSVAPNSKTVTQRQTSYDRTLSGLGLSLSSSEDEPPTKRVTRSRTASRAGSDVEGPSGNTVHAPVEAKKRRIAHTPALMKSSEVSRDNESAVTNTSLQNETQQVRNEVASLKAVSTKRIVNRSKASPAVKDQSVPTATLTAAPQIASVKLPTKRTTKAVTKQSVKATTPSRKASSKSVSGETTLKSTKEAEVEKPSFSFESFASTFCAKPGNSSTKDGNSGGSKSSKPVVSRVKSSYSKVALFKMLDVIRMPPKIQPLPNALRATQQAPAQIQPPSAAMVTTDTPGDSRKRTRAADRLVAPERKRTSVLPFGHSGRQTAKPVTKKPLSPSLSANATVTANVNERKTKEKPPDERLSNESFEPNEKQAAGNAVPKHNVARQKSHESKQMLKPADQTKAALVSKELHNENVNTAATIELSEDSDEDFVIQDIEETNDTATKPVEKSTASATDVAAASNANLQTSDDVPGVESISTIESVSDLELPTLPQDCGVTILAARVRLSEFLAAAYREEVTFASLNETLAKHVKACKDLQTIDWLKLVKALMKAQRFLESHHYVVGCAAKMCLDDPKAMKAERVKVAPMEAALAVIVSSQLDESKQVQFRKELLNDSVAMNKDLRKCSYGDTGSLMKLSSFVRLLLLLTSDALNFVKPRQDDVTNAQNNIDKVWLTIFEEMLLPMYEGDDPVPAGKWTVIAQVIWLSAVLTNAVDLHRFDGGLRDSPAFVLFHGEVTCGSGYRYWSDTCLRLVKQMYDGNLPFDATEEGLRELFGKSGDVTSIRMVQDRDSGKSKGYCFVEYADVEQSRMALRNMNNIEYNGRALRVGTASGDQLPSDSGFGRTGGEPHGGIIPAQERIFGEEVSPDQAPEKISQTIASLPPEQMYDLMVKMKDLTNENPHEARQLLTNNPQLAYGILQAQIILKIVDPQTALTMLHKPYPSAPLPSSGHAPAPVSLPPPPPANLMLPSAPPPPPSNMVPSHLQHMTQQPPVQQQPSPAMMQQQHMPQHAAATRNAPDEVEDAHQLFTEIMNLTQEEIDQLPPEERAQILALREEFMQSQ